VTSTDVVEVEAESALMAETLVLAQGANDFPSVWYDNGIASVVDADEEDKVRNYDESQP
jgi:hypothetical protein